MSCREVDSALHLASCPIWLVSWREGGSLGLAPGLLFYLADELEGGSLGPAPGLLSYLGDELEGGSLGPAPGPMSHLANELEGGSLGPAPCLLSYLAGERLVKLEGGSLGPAPGLLSYLAGELPDELEGGSLGPATLLVPLLNLAEDPLLLSHHQVLVIQPAVCNMVTWTSRSNYKGIGSRDRVSSNPAGSSMKKQTNKKHLGTGTNFSEVEGFRPVHPTLPFGSSSAGLSLAALSPFFCLCSCSYLLASRSLACSCSLWASLAFSRCSLAACSS